MIEIALRAVRDYLVSCGVVAIFVTSVGKLGIGRDLARAAPLAAAWWVRDRRTAEQILIAIGEEHPQTVEEATRAVEAAAARLGVTLNDHAAVMQRTRAAGRPAEWQARGRHGGTATCSSSTAPTTHIASAASNAASTRCHTAPQWPACASSWPELLPGRRCRMWWRLCLGGDPLNMRGVWWVICR